MRQRERERERERGSRGGAERERERERRERIPSTLHVVSTEPNVGLNPMKHGIMT